MSEIFERGYVGRLEHSITSAVSELHAGPNFSTRPDPTWKKRRPNPTWPANFGQFLDPTRPAGLSIKRKNHKTPSHEHRVAFRKLMKSLSTHPTSQINAVYHECFVFCAIVHRQYSVQITLYNWAYWLVLQPMANWLASALPVAYAVSFEFDGINVTSQHVMAQMLWCTPLMLLLGFYDQFSKDCRARKVSAHWCFYERTNEREAGYKLLWWCLPPQLAVKQRDRRRHWRRHFYNWCSQQLQYNSRAIVTLSLIFAVRYVAHYILKTTREILTIQLRPTLCKLKCKIKHIYQGTLKLNFSFWPNWTRPNPPFPVNFLTRRDPTRPGSRVVQLCAVLLLNSSIPKNAPKLCYIMFVKV